MTEARERQSALFLGALRLIMRALASQEISGMENLPGTGPGLLVFNQLSLFDTPLMRLSIPRPDVAGLVARDYRSNAFYRFLIERSGGIWIRRGASDRPALKAALAALERGWLVCISPEGRRSRSGGLERGKPGVAFLARRARVPIIPVALVNVRAISTSLRRLRRAAVSIRIGRPFELAAGSMSWGREERQQAVDLIMCHVAALLPESYRGVYAHHPLLPTAAPAPGRSLP